MQERKVICVDETAPYLDQATNPMSLGLWTQVSLARTPSSTHSLHLQSSVVTSASRHLHFCHDIRHYLEILETERTVMHLYRDRTTTPSGPLLSPGPPRLPLCRSCGILWVRLSPLTSERLVVQGAGGGYRYRLPKHPHHSPRAVLESILESIRRSRRQRRPELSHYLTF